MSKYTRYIGLSVLTVFLTAFISPIVFAQGGYSSIMINGSPYFSIDALSHEKGLAVQWDPILKNAVVTGASGFLKLHADSEFILRPEGLIKLREKILYHQGELMAPLSAAAYFERLAPPMLNAVSQPPTHRIKRVVIDAGHGGYDLGAISPSGFQEKVIALRIAELVASELRGMGIETILTRSYDNFVPLPQRSKIANEEHADFFISIHANASLSRSLKGFEVYYLSQESDDASVALANAENEVFLGTAHVQSPTKDVKAIYLDLEASENRKESIFAARDIAAAAQRSVSIGAQRVKSAQFHVLKWTECPSILVETGYLTNPEDEKKLSDPNYQEDLARAIATGFFNYKLEFEKTDGFTK